MKKVLIVSSYAPPAIGGPQNLYNLFRDFPIDRYVILTSYYNIDDLSALKGLWLPGEYIFYDKNTTRKLRIVAAENGSIESKRSQKIQKLRFLMKRIGIIRVLAGLPVILSQILAIIHAGKRIISIKNIDILLGFSDYGPAMLGTYLLHKLTGKPYYIFLFDLYKGNFLPFPGELFAKLFEKRILKKAEKIIVTNSGTKKLYRVRYGQKIAEKIIIIHNSVFPEAHRQEVEDGKLSENKIPTILFTGRIYWPQIGALKNLINAINEMSLDIKLEIYSPSPRDYLKEIGIEESEKVKLSVASPTEIPIIQSNADILFLPLSWNTKSQAIIDTATPGKLTDYLIAGKPILVHAPASSYLVKYAKERNFALTIDQENVEQLKAGIKKLLTEPVYVEELVKNARTTFFENHDANKNALLMQDLFQNI